MKRVKFTVYLIDGHVAKFSDHQAAMTFARQVSAFGCVEVSDKSGLIGQFIGGKSTPEFRNHKFS